MANLGDVVTSTSAGASHAKGDAGCSERDSHIVGGPDFTRPRVFLMRVCVCVCLTAEIYLREVTC